MIQKWLYPFIINHFIVFLGTALRGTIITLSANSWWVGWLGMEINLLGFIILLINNRSNESSLKYFVIQSLGSVILISTALLTENFYYKNFQLLIAISIFLKLGSAPLHYWLPVIVETLTKYQLTFLLTWQKIAPLYLLFALPLQSVTYIFIISRLFIGAVNSINELRLFTLITYSSINHTGWILLSAITNELIRIIYIIVYTALITRILVPLNNKNNQSIWNLKNSKNFLLFFSLLSLGGLPPFTGFAIKWILIAEIYTLTNIIVIIITILTSIILLYFYIRITINCFFKNELTLKFLKKTKPGNLFIFSIINLPGIYLLF